MRKSRFTEERIVAILAEQERGAACGGGLPAARDQRHDVVQVEGEVRRHGCLRRPKAQEPGGRERAAEAPAGRSDARQRGAQGSAGKELTTPSARRAAALRAMRGHDLSQRRACRLVGAGPKTVRRERVPDCPEIRTRMREIAAERRRFGCRRIGLMLEREGIMVNGKKLRRLYKEAGLAVRRRRGRKRATGTREPMPMPAAPRERWSLDFLADVFGPGRRFRILAVTCDHTRECLALVADTSISGERVGLLGSMPWSGSTGRAQNDRQRQRDRAHEPSDPALAGRGRGRLALHHPRQADRKRLHRELQRASQGRVPERGGLRRPRPCPARPDAPAPRLQPREAALVAGRADPRAGAAGVQAPRRSPGRRTRAKPHDRLPSRGTPPMTEGVEGRRSARRAVPTVWDPAAPGTTPRTPRSSCARSSLDPQAGEWR